MIKLIVAYSENRVIGKDNKLLWKLSNDLKRFKELTLNHPIIMGRKTFESLPKVLPNRQNIVVTSRTENLPSAVYGVKNIQDAFNLAKTFSEDFFIIGGGEIYSQTLPFTDVLEITLVHIFIEGDTFFPEFDTSNFNLISNETFSKDEKNEFDYTFLTYRRKK